MKTSNVFKNYRLMSLLLATLFIASCSDDDDATPPPGGDLEVITDVTLVFTNTQDPNDVVMASAVDPDGEGVMELAVDGAIDLTEGVTYDLTFDILNALDADDVEDIGEEILEEDDEHQIFFGFTDGAFGSPMGDGNIDTASDPVNYNDEDENGNPVGLVTQWTAGDVSAGGTFRVRLQHQPDLKSATTTSEDGDTDFDLTFALNIQEDPNAPPVENEAEVITDVTLVFTNTADATDVVMASAQDPDGEGVLELEIDGPINLTEGVTYTMTFEILNALDADDVEDIGEEILEEDNEHQIFFSFTDGVFTSPTGDGNIGADSAADPVNYMDMDENGNPVGLVTEWTAGGASTDGTFRVRLQHQPDLKSATTTSEDGDTDFDLSFVLNIQ